MMQPGALENSPEESHNTQCGGCCTRVTNLSVKAGAASIIENINLHFHCGQFSVITGPNGAGKSTLIKAIA
ncbi:MAG: ATP-binding cassette domain-containing protein, partial [Chitinispirillales bacterium]|nr:ATP-binding cassette domain-containing protein [Chitinispirillales bacterium]